MTEMIKIRPPQHSLGTWRASCIIPASWATAGRMLAGVRHEGGAEGYPPFIKAEGRTPEEAVQALYARLGEAWLGVRACEGFAVPLGASPREVRLQFELTLEEVDAVLTLAEAFPVSARPMGGDRVLAKLEATARAAHSARLGHDPKA